MSRHGEQANRRTRGLIATAVAVAACALPLALASTGVVQSRLFSHRSPSSSSQDPETAQHARTHITAQRSDRFVQVQAQRGLRPGWLLLLKGRTAAAIAVSGNYLAWELEPSDGHPVSALMERNRTGRTRQLAASVLSQFGLASTRTRVVYAGAGASGSELRAIRHDGRDGVVLSRSLAAPFASRGNVIAWAEQVGAHQRVVVRNMNTGRQWVAARMRRCNGDQCYRIDTVTLADDDGVVFDRGAIGSQPSLIVRRRLRDAKPTIARVKNDPQPDLAPSSAGAFYFWLQHGWMRWDFGQQRPRPTHLEGLRWWVVGYEHGRLLLRTGPQCRPRLLVRLPGKRDQVVAAPDSTPASPKDFGPLCRVMTGFAWQGRRLVVAWAITPRISLNAHTDAGLVGVVTETTTH